MKLSRENTNLVKIGQNVGHFTSRSKYVYIVDSSTTFFAARPQHKRDPLLRFQQHSTVLYCFTLLTVPYDATIYREGNVDCPLQQWLSKRATVLH
jgi:hypothetical protein